jgi:hypothetical protein
LSTSVNGDERDDALWLIVNGAGHEGDWADPVRRETVTELTEVDDISVAF